MALLNYLPKVQALDKSIATLAEVRPHHSVVSVLDLDPNNRIASCAFLSKLLCEVSDAIVVMGRSRLHDEALSIARERGIPCVDLAPVPVGRAARDVIAFAEPYLRDGLGARSGDQRTVYLAPYTGGATPLGDALAWHGRRRGFRVFSYFKSLHDQGAGFSVAPEVTEIPQRSGEESRDGPRARLGRWRRELSARLGRFSLKPRREHVDRFLAVTDRHVEILAAAGFPAARLVPIGYPLLYPAWQRLVRGSAEYREYEKSGHEVVIFTRGETPGRPPEQNVLPHATLERILADIFAELDSVFPGSRIRIKPHPIQDMDFLRQLIAGRANVSLTFDPPALVAGTADLAISTYSSTVLDAMIFGVPSVEYYVENDFFRRKHPGGSPFVELGATRVETAYGFRDVLQHLREGRLEQPDVAQRLGHRRDLRVFGVGVSRELEPSPR